MKAQTDQLRFARAYIYPAVGVMIVPIITLVFFCYAQSALDKLARTAFIRAVEEDTQPNERQRSELIQAFESVRLSRILRSSSTEWSGLKEHISNDTKWQYATYLWLIRLSCLSIATTLIACVCLGLSVMIARHWENTLYFNLKLAWIVMQGFAVSQVILQAGMLCALSYWVTVLWFEFYVPGLVVLMGIVAIASLVPVLQAAFARIDDTLPVTGHVIKRSAAPSLWERLTVVNAKVGAELPSQVIVGIDDCFFVTENVVTVNHVSYRGRTLFLSLPLLKILNGNEADAVLAHELAHFSGHDTQFTRKISPLLARYSNYLTGLEEGITSRPVYCYALFFWNLYQLAVAKRSRQREFRADRLSVESTSKQAAAGALVRVTAYSAFRNSVEREMFSGNMPIARANISGELEAGFRAFELESANLQAILDFTSTHPYDTHPPLDQRLTAMDVPASVDGLREILSEAGDGAWFGYIDDGPNLEQSLWAEYEEKFRDVHEATVVYRCDPETEEERSLVEKHFPPMSLPVRRGKLVTFDFEKITFEGWTAPLKYSEIVLVEITREWGVPTLQFTLEREGRYGLSLPLSKSPSEQRAVLDTYERYASRQKSAAIENSHANG